eukprot:262828-Rhodomonas_salina.1
MTQKNDLERAVPRCQAVAVGVCSGEREDEVSRSGHKVWILKSREDLQRIPRRDGRGQIRSD